MSASPWHCMWPGRWNYYEAGTCRGQVDRKALNEWRWFCGDERGIVGSCAEAKRQVEEALARRAP